MKREGWCRRRGYENVYGIALCSHRLADSTRWYYDNTKFVLVCKGVSSLFFINAISSLSQPQSRLGFFEDFFLKYFGDFFFEFPLFFGMNFFRNKFSSNAQKR